MKAIREMRKSQKGFTLIEIMIVVLIIGILLAIAIPNFVKARDASQTKACIANLKQLDTAQQQFMMKSPTPAAVVMSDLAGTSTDYIKKIPTCPSGLLEYKILIDTPPACLNKPVDHVLP